MASPRSTSSQLLPTHDSVTVTFDGAVKVYPISTFCTGKAVRVIELVTELAGIPEINAFLRGADDSNRGSKLSDLVAALPQIVSNFKPLLTRLSGLVLIKNSEFAKLDFDGGLEERMVEVGKEVMYADEGLALLAELITLSIKHIDFGKLRDAFGLMTSAIPKTQTQA